MSTKLTPTLALGGALVPAGAAQAAEYPVGEPVTKNGLEVGAAYLQGVELEPTPPAPAGEDTVHLECDISAAVGNAQGFEEGQFGPYLTCSYLVEKVGTDWRRAGTMLPMTARDGPHYAADVPMRGPGEYRLVYFLEPPSRNGFFRHTDEASGVAP